FMLMLHESIRKQCWTGNGRLDEAGSPDHADPTRKAHMATSEVLVQDEGSCRHLVLNRPERLNAVSEGLYTQSLSALREAERDRDVRCVVISGAGKAFCAGADLKAHGSGTRTAEQRTEYVELGQRVCAQIQQMGTPVIAQVHGYALGGGAEIATSADFLVVAQDAQIGFPEVKIGTYLGGGVTHRLPRLIGLRRATRLLLLGEQIDGAEALAAGLAHAAPSQEDLAATTTELVEQLSRNAPQSISRIKAALATNRSLEETFASEAADLLAIMETQDWAEGVAAF
ncbi:MAG: hypothetical protein GEU88_20450, partial [Solirubrobacterales bacterium]|nr:hypothetical protein [Solirubrobacterales bacterium]